MNYITYKNHLNIDLFLYQNDFEEIITRDEKKAPYFEKLLELFKNADEVYLYEHTDILNPSEWIPACKYIKFFKGCALFGIVDITQMMEPRIIDFYLIDETESIMIEGKEENRINYERRGWLIKKG